MKCFYFATNCNGMQLLPCACCSGSAWQRSVSTMTGAGRVSLGLIWCGEQVKRTKTFHHMLDTADKKQNKKQWICKKKANKGMKGRAGECSLVEKRRRRTVADTSAGPYYPFWQAIFCRLLPGSKHQGYLFLLLRKPCSHCKKTGSGTELSWDGLFLAIRSRFIPCQLQQATPTISCRHREEQQFRLFGDSQLFLSRCRHRCKYNL